MTIVVGLVDILYTDQYGNGRETSRVHIVDSTQSEFYSSVNFVELLGEIRLPGIKYLLNPKGFRKIKKLTILGIKFCNNNQEKFRATGDPDKDFPVGLRVLHGKNFYQNKLDEVDQYFDWIERYCDPSSRIRFYSAEEFERFVEFAEPIFEKGESAEDIYKTLLTPRSLMQQEISGKRSAVLQVAKKYKEARLIEFYHSIKLQHVLEKIRSFDKKTLKKVSAEPLENNVRKRGNTKDRESDNKMLRLS